MVAPQDEVLDVLGFLAYECVRALCDAGVAHKKSVVEAKRQAAEMEKRRKIREGKKRKRDEVAEPADEGAGAEANTTDEAALKAEDPSTPASNASPGQARSPNKKDKKDPTNASPSRKTLTDIAGPTNDKQPSSPSSASSSSTSSSSSSSSSSPKRKPLEIPTSLFSAPLPDAAASVPAFGAAAAAVMLLGDSGDANGGTAAASAGESASAAAARVLFRLEDVELGLHAVEHTYASLKTSGMRNWRGGISRIPTRLV